MARVRSSKGARLAGACGGFSVGDGVTSAGVVSRAGSGSRAVADGEEDDDERAETGTSTIGSVLPPDLPDTGMIKVPLAAGVGRAGAEARSGCLLLVAVCCQHQTRPAVASRQRARNRMPPAGRAAWRGRSGCRSRNLTLTVFGKRAFRLKLILLEWTGQDPLEARAVNATASEYFTPVPPKMSRAEPMVRSIRPPPRRVTVSRSASERAPPA